MQNSVFKGLLFAVPMASVLAQTTDLKMGAVYACPAVQATMQVYSCAGPGAGDLCDVQTAPSGRPAMRPGDSGDPIAAGLRADSRDRSMFRLKPPLPFSRCTGDPPDFDSRAWVPS